MLQNNKIYIGIALLVLAIISVAVYLFDGSPQVALPDGTHEKAKETALVKRNSFSAGRKDAVADDVAAEAVSGMAANGLDNEFLRDELSRTDSIKDFVDTYMRQAESGDREAQYALYRAMSECVAPRSYEEQEKLAEALRTLGRSEAQIERSWREYSRCAGLEAGDYPSAAYWRERALESGHPAAVSEMLGEIAKKDPGTADSWAISTAATGDPDALWNVGLYLAERNTIVGSDLSEHYQDAGVAFMLAGCEAGYRNCRPNSNLMMTLCETGNCSPELSYEEYLLQYQLPPARADAALALVQKLRDTGLDEQSIRDLMFPGD